MGKDIAGKRAASLRDVLSHAVTATLYRVAGLLFAVACPPAWADVIYSNFSPGSIDTSAPGYALYSTSGPGGGSTVAFEFTTPTQGTYALGQIIALQPIAAAQGATATHLALDRKLPTGIYFYNILDDTSLIRAQGKFQFQN